MRGNFWVLWCFVALLPVFLCRGCKEEISVQSEPTERKKADALLEQIFYDVNAMVGYNGDYLSCRGVKSIPRIFFKPSAGEIYRGNMNPETMVDSKLGKRLGNYMDFTVSDVVPYEKYTRVFCPEPMMAKTMKIWKPMTFWRKRNFLNHS